MLFRTIVAFCVGWAVLYAAQHYWLTAMTAEVTQNSGLQLLPPAPAFPTVGIDPEKMRQAINPPVNIDTRKYERLAIESMARQTEQQNRAALDRAALPPSIPRSPYH